MQPFHNHKEFFNSLVLTGDQDPYEIIKDYFDDREMYEVVEFDRDCALFP
jgi:hypothetical protein